MGRSPRCDLITACHLVSTAAGAQLRNLGERTAAQDVGAFVLTIVAPAWGQKQIANRIVPTARATKVSCDVGVLPEGYPHWVVSGDILCEAVANGFSFDLGAERTE